MAHIKFKYYSYNIEIKSDSLEWKLFIYKNKNVIVEDGKKKVRYENLEVGHFSFFKSLVVYLVERFGRMSDAKTLSELANDFNNIKKFLYDLICNNREKLIK